MCLPQTAVQSSLSLSPGLTGVGIHRLNFRAVESLQKHIHGGHDRGMCIEGAAGKTNIARAVIAKALHPCRFTAHHPDRQAAAQGLAVSDHVGVNAKVSLSAAMVQTKTQKHFIHDECDAFFCTDLSQSLQPRCIGLPVVMHRALAINQGAVSGCSAVRVHGLQRVDQHTGDVLAVAQNTQGVGMHIVQGEGVARRRHGVAWSWLHIVPPAVISTCEAHNFSLLGVVAGQTDGLHHRFGARHVKRHLVLARQGTQALDVVQHTRVVTTQNRSQVLRHGCTFGHAGFVKVVAKQIHAIRTRHIDELVAIHVSEPYALARTPKTAQLQVLRQQFSELVGHTVLAGELHIGDHGLGRSGVRQRQRTSCFELDAQFVQGSVACMGNVWRRTVDRKPSLRAVAVGWQPVGKALRHTQVSTQGRVFGKRQLQALNHSLQQDGSRHRRHQAQHH